MTTIARRLASQFPNTNSGIGAIVIPMREQMVGNTGTAVLVLLAGAGCVLLIACANVANLLLAKTVGRSREMAIRAALGASRQRLVGQLLAESLLLALLGGAGGLGLAVPTMRLLAVLVPMSFALSSATALDARLLAFNLMASVITGIVFGIAPAMKVTATSVAIRLKEGGRAGVGGGGRRFRDALIVAEVALTLVLLVSAGLLMETLYNLRGIDAGFNPHNILTLTTRLTASKYSDPNKRMQYFDAVLERVRALPGVEQAGFTSSVPFTARGDTRGFKIDGIQFPPSERPDAIYREVTNDYLQTMRTKLLEGRFFGTEDRANSTPVAIINEAFKRQYWPRESPLGRRVETGTGQWQTIVGVVSDVRETGLEADVRPGVCVPVVQVPTGSNIPSQLAIRTSLDPHAVIQAVHEAIREVDKDQPISGIRTMEEIVDLEVADHTQQTLVLGSFAGLALLLASLGVYSVLSYSVTQRTREIGIRMALGASACVVTGTVVRQGLGLASLGVGIGSAIAFGATRSMTKLLVGVKPTDLAIYAGVAAIVMVVALVACYFPASRAAHVDPLVALREE